MTASEILRALAIGEDTDWEFKSARGGLPRSMWETYSAMANTEGGTIVLGVKEERDHTFAVDGLDDPAKMRADFWSAVNDRAKVSVNLLSDERVTVEEVLGRPLLVVRVPAATRQQRPVYVGQNPLLGTYRRNFDGDFHCTEQEVGRMLADRSAEPADLRILDGFGSQDMDVTSLAQYRQRFSARAPNHPWLAEKPKGFLEKLGGWRRDRTTGQEGVTVAGLLMFGKDEAIRDPGGVPEFHLDFRERFSDDPEIRWTDRLTFDGTWVCNLFQFYQRVIQKLTADLKTPFRLEPDLFRKDDTIVHEAVREAVVNALIHADHRGQGGVVIEKCRDRFELSNPGTLLLPRDQILLGGVSECRNKTLQTMFLLIGGGEKAGSGIDKIRQGWSSQHWRSPSIQPTFQPDRVRLVMPMVSLLPEESLQKLRQRFGEGFARLSPSEVQALVTADVEGRVSNSRLREISEEHPADLTRVLQSLVGRGYLEQVGQKRGASYRLPGPAGGRSPEEGDILHKQLDIPHNAEDIPRKPDEPSPGAETDPALLQIAAPARRMKRLPPTEMEPIILDLCQGRFLTVRQIATLLKRNPNGVRDRFLTRMVEVGQLDMLFPGEPKRPGQAYTSHATGEGNLEDPLGGSR